MTIRYVNEHPTLYSSAFWVLKAMFRYHHFNNWTSCISQTKNRSNYSVFKNKYIIVIIFKGCIPPTLYGRYVIDVLKFSQVACRSWISGSYAKKNLLNCVQLHRTLLGASRVLFLIKKLHGIEPVHRLSYLLIPVPGILACNCSGILRITGGWYRHWHRNNTTTDTISACQSHEKVTYEWNLISKRNKSK